MENRTSGGVGETIKTLVYAVLIALFIRTFLYEPFTIPSGSMVPTLLVGDYIFVSKFSYGYSRYSLPLGLPLIPGRIFFSSPQQGDVVVFRLPSDPSTDYIKRVIGMPGDKVQVIKGVVHINGVPAKLTRVGSYADSAVTRLEYMETLPGGREHMILLSPVSEAEAGPRCDDPKDYTGDAENTCPFIVPPEHYFMMGDNRDNSSDSRVRGSGVGMVPKENLVGHAQLIFFSIGGSSRIWEVWNWFSSIRYTRLFTAIH